MYIFFFDFYRLNIIFFLFKDSDIIIDERSYSSPPSKPWKTSPVEPNNIITSCGYKIIFGGFQTLSTETIEKSFQNLPPHYMAYVKFTILKIDQWNSGANLELYIDDNLAKSQDVSSVNEATWSINYCGDSNQKDQEIDFYHSFLHKSVDLKISIKTSGNSNLQYWGLLRFEAAIFKCNPSCSSCKDSITCNDCAQDQISVGGLCRCLNK